MRLTSAPLQLLGRSLAVILCSLAGLLFLRHTVAAQINSDQPTPLVGNRPQTDEPVFTWLVTVSVESGAPLAPALYSRWANVVLSVPVLVPDNQEAIYNPIALPSDATDITASVVNGQFAIVTTTIYYTLFQGSVDMAWSYRTLQNVQRTGNQYQVNQRTSSNKAFRNVSTVFFSTPYQYVGSITFTPQLVTSDMLKWDLSVPQNTPPDRHVFNPSSWLVDPRLGQPDLDFADAAISIDSQLNPPIAYLTATVRNHNYVDITSTASNIAFLEFYDRSSPSAPPGGPLDHAGGWCGTGNAPACPASATFTNPIPSLASGASVTVFMTYPLQLPGLRDYYFQIDTFGGANGLNSELDETNNIYTLARGITIDYLASVVINGPLTGAAHTPLAFNAQVTPALAVSQPLTYTWSPLPNGGGQGTANVTYTWDTGTPQVITVTVRNAQQTTVTGTHTISIEVPLTGALITGPITVSRNIPYAYSVSAQPLTATLPITYLWDPEPDQGQHTTVATYSLTSLGVQTLTVQLNNLIGPVITATHAVTSVLPLTTVVIDGPAVGQIIKTYIFSAAIGPADAAPPLSYQWSPLPDNGQGAPQAVYHWTTAGAQNISVTVRNDSGAVTGTHTISIAVPLTDALITGPITVSRNIPYAYSVSAQPLTATLPITYLWEPEPDQGQHTAVATYSLTSLGVQTLTVQLNNLIGPVITATHAVTSVPPLTTVVIDGPAVGQIIKTYIFSAAIGPADAAPPLSYQWSPQPDSGQGAPQAAYYWTTTGTQDISVTVRNDSGAVTGTHTISIAVPLIGALITGPITVSRDIPYAYSVSMQPVTATLPITYLWEPEPDQGQHTAVATYSLTSLGVQTLTVQLNNLIGPVITATHAVTSVPPLTTVVINGPVTGRLNTLYFFTATIGPAEAASPIDYQWSPAPGSGQGAAQVRYLWTTPGTQLITVTAYNDSGSVIGHHTIDVTGGNLYLPLIRK
jgi:hypothetical protein